jgi:hypothetical protein
MEVQRAHQHAITAHQHAIKILANWIVFNTAEAAIHRHDGIDSRSPHLSPCGLYRGPCGLYLCHVGHDPCSGPAAPGARTARGHRAPPTTAGLSVSNGKPTGRQHWLRCTVLRGCSHRVFMPLDAATLHRPLPAAAPREGQRLTETSAEHRLAPHRRLLLPSRPLQIRELRHSRDQELPPSKNGTLAGAHGLLPDGVFR